MSPSDKNKSPGNSSTEEGQSQLCSDSCIMDFSSESTSPSTSNVTLPGHGTIVNIPWVTASQSTIKCSVNDQMKPFDPGEDGGIERLTSTNGGNSVFLGKSSSSLIKSSNRNYKAGSKINKLADMLAKRSQNVVEVKQSNLSGDIIVDITSAPKVEEERVISNNISNVMKSMNGSLFENPKNSNELNLFRKSRRKSVPNQSCSIQQWQLQSTSKSCSDISKLFPMEKNDNSELNALGGSMIKLQTDESTKKKLIRKNLRNVKLPLILPERKRRSSIKSDSLVSCKLLEKVVEETALIPTEKINKSKEASNESPASSVQNSKPSVRCMKVKKESKVKQRKSKRLVENSTQTADIEFISVIKPEAEVVNEKPLTDETEKPAITYECLYCTQKFTLGSLCKAHEKTHSLRNNKQFKCQYCSKKLTSLDELKSHCVQKHPNKYAYCVECDERFPTKEDLYSHKELHLNKNRENQNEVVEEVPKSPSQEDTEEKTEKKVSKNAPKTDLKIDVSYDTTKKASVSPRNIQKCSPKETKSEEQLLEMEMLFYSNLSGNIRENLTNHLDGKLDKSGNPVRTDRVAESTDCAKTSSLLSVAAPVAGVPDVQVSRAPSPYQTRSKTPNPLPPTAKKFKKLPNWQQKFWEKYNFPTNYRLEHRFWDKNYLNSEKSAFYLKDLSCLDIKTQLTMRENIKKLDEIKKIEENLKPSDKFKFPEYLFLVPRANVINSPENKVDSQKSNSECPKSKKQTGKEEAKKSFKLPGPELPEKVVKSRSRIASDSNLGVKKQNTEGVKMMTRRQSSLELMKDEKEENSKKRKGSLDLSGNQRMTLRRQTSLDNIGSNASNVERNDQVLESDLSNGDSDSVPVSPTESAEISGEWVRPRSYLCGTCCTKFTNLWELEDHKWISHPNVWCTHYEFEDDKIDKLFQKNEGESAVESEESPETSKSKLTDLYKRYLLPHGSLKTAKLVPKTNFPEQCTKCKKNCMNSSEMHKHMLDCGGDTTWFLTMYSSPMTIKRKWRPFGSRRKKQIGRRDVKRNIPSTPTLRSYHYQHRIRTKPGDVESIQKMLANLPEKRARRAINFDEIKTRSQATIHSNRLLRKRFKSSFSNNFLKLKTMKQKRAIKQGKKEGSSKSTTDTSSESTPVGSPKRRNKLKENLQLLKEENSRDCSSETSENVNVKITKKKVQSKKKEPPDLTLQKIEGPKVDKTKIKKEISEVAKEKPVTRSNGFVLSAESKSKKKAPVVKEETQEETEGSLVPIKEQKSSKSGKKTKKTGKTTETPIKKEVAVSDDPDLSYDANATKGKETSVRVAKKMKMQAENTSEPRTSNKKNSNWANARCNPILRLKQNNKAKTELLKNMQKKLKNSRKILEKKEVEKTESGNRRSLRLRSLQQSEGDSENFAKQTTDSVKKLQTVICEKDLKIKTVVVSLENAVISKVMRPLNRKSPKVCEQKVEKEISETPIVRRSLRNSISSEEKPEIVQNGNSTLAFNPRSLLKRNLRNDPPVTTVAEKVELPKSPGVCNEGNARSVDGNSLAVNSQVSLLKRNRIQSLRSLRIIKLEDFSEGGNSHSNKNNDLEEMPILAKVEPILGKINKNEKEIPVLMPMEKEEKKNTNEEEGVAEEEEEEEPKEDDSVSFQVIKKRRKNSKEITPLKIIKKVDSVENGNRMNTSESISPVDGEKQPETGKNKKKRLSDTSIAEAVEKQVRTDVKKYFLGIDPTEIDKGRNEAQDESGSDNEPLICLISKQIQNEHHTDDPIPKEEVISETEKEKLSALETSVKKSKNKQKEIEKIPSDLPILTPPSAEESNKVPPPVSEAEVEKLNYQLKKKTLTNQKKKTPSRAAKELCMTVSLKEPTLKILDKPVDVDGNKWSKAEEPDVKENVTVGSPSLDEDLTSTAKDSFLPQRRSRRISKETKSSNEFVIDDPLILVDELWSDLDSDSDSSKRKSKKGKKKSPKKKTAEEKRASDVNLEELLRNFGEKKENKKSEQVSSSSPTVVVKILKNRTRISDSLRKMRKAVENRKIEKSYRRLSLKLFRFSKTRVNLGCRGVKLSDAKKALKQKLDEMQAKSDALPDLPFLAAEIKENPEQVIQCRSQKSKLAKKSIKKIESRSQNSDIHMKISLPLDIVNNMTVFNNNHLTELIVEEPKQSPAVVEEVPQPEKDLSGLVETSTEKQNRGIEDEQELQEANDLKNKSKRSEVIDKIFYCEICKTYYYSPSQLKIHKLSNRHKLKESELLQPQDTPVQVETTDTDKEGLSKTGSLIEPIPVVENVQEPSGVENAEADRLNDDTLEMPTLEGPFIENPLTRVTSEPIQAAPPPPPISNFGFSQESLKDIQKAIGCTDEEMLILTLLGENTIEVENDILDLDSCKPAQSKPPGTPKEKVESSLKENEKANGAFKVDLKQRMTSALACLVNKAVFNLLQKYETAAKSAVNSEALSLLGKLSNLSRRKNILQLNELLKKRNDGEPSLGPLQKDLEKKEPTISYKYQCTICGSRFEKASTRECHISRSHKGKAKKPPDDTPALQTTHEDEWNDTWNYDGGDDHLESTNASQFWCSDCGINFLSPQDVLEHQKLEHQAAPKESEQNRDSGPLQSSTIGSSDEILEGKKTRKKPKLFSSEELDQQRIIANNELRKLDRKFSNKNKNSKIKWGMDALKFTVEKENKIVVAEEEKEVIPEEPLKPTLDVKNIDLVPKLNLSRISNIPEFKVIQKNSFENRFQKIIDNKLKRKCVCPSQEESAADEIEEEVMLVPVVVKKKNKKQKVNKCFSKKEETGKPLDVYDFNESESEGEPAVYSHIKKPAPSPTKLKLVKVKEGPSKNKADSTTKDLAPDDYDSEDSLPLSVVKKSKPGEEDDEKDEKISDDGVEKSDGILEQVEYLIEQLENETGSSKKGSDTKEMEFDCEPDLGKGKITELLKEDSVNSVFMANEGLRVSVANKYLELEDLPLKIQKPDDTTSKKLDIPLEEERLEDSPEREGDSILAEPESSQSTFDEEDSIPLVLISKKAEKSKFNQEEKKCDENTTDVSTTASEDVSLTRTEENKRDGGPQDSPINAQMGTEESQPPVFSSSENEGAFSDLKSDKPFQTLNGNVIYCRNDSMTDFESDLSSDGLVDSNFEKNSSRESGKNFIKEVTEKEDVVIVCSKGVEEESNESKASETQLKDTEHSLRKKKRFPLLTATIEENNFRRSESPKSNKEVIVRKIWNRKKLTEESTDNEEDSYLSVDDHNTCMENFIEDESQTEIEKEIIVKKIWSRKKHELEDEFNEKAEEKFDDIKINQTEISDEVVIKCGPKAKSCPKRRKSKGSTSEASKDTIMRKIWSGRCTFQTKAALKTYDSDVLPNCKENEVCETQNKSKRRKRPTSFSPTKRSKVESEIEKEDDDDDLDSLLEEIEREQLEKAIRSEFLQLRRSEKANVEMKEAATPSVGLFTETTLNSRKEISDKKRRKVRKKIKHPRQSLLKRRKLIRKPFRRVLPNEERNFSESTNRANPDGSTEQSENSLDKNVEAFGAETKSKNRKHKKHRHKHHHHKHKHKKSKHHKSAGLSKHKNKHEFPGKEEEVGEEGEDETRNTDSFTILEKICQDIPNQIENESHLESRTSKRRTSSDASAADSRMGDLFLFESQIKSGGPEFENGHPGKKRYESVNIYDFIDDVPDFSAERMKNLKK